MSDFKGAANRRSPRRVFNRPVGVLVRGQYEIVRAVQISEGGMLLQIPWVLQKGDLIVLSILLPSGGHTVVRAEILYDNKVSDGAEYGVKFQQVSLAQRRAVRNYVSAKTEEEAEQELLS